MAVKEISFKTRVAPRRRESQTGRARAFLFPSANLFFKARVLTFPHISSSFTIYRNGSSLQLLLVSAQQSNERDNQLE